ncbi:DUF4834 family protein [Hyunsoonleella pacifica]|uniref:DUF4834 family protein n=1 Tax=Hyunsoonleella pacifica TaxID=1080224 RepID=A0A4Q9FQB2_9FLAO|nr:DUF4834 family protein [Hyunsoonleella pacifica]TBN17631.1 DUF4834 family protein [Hyunsoonleella pacifica]GGD10279.1 hypothetical protein GCM10011368_10330 [Hyunsoonleella pacifica]
MLQEASIIGLIKIIGIILLVYYGVKVLSRLLTPFLLRYVSKKAEEKFGGQFNQQRHEAPKKEGEVTIDKIPNRKASNKNVGDYVDYEEID